MLLTLIGSDLSDYYNFKICLEWAEELLHYYKYKSYFPEAWLMSNYLGLNSGSGFFIFFSNYTYIYLYNISNYI